jgi:MFS superfamily sulfate permease-like transporter
MVSVAISGVAPPRPVNGTEAHNASSSVLSWFCGENEGEIERDDNLAVEAAVTMCFLVGVFQVCHKFLVLTNQKKKIILWFQIACGLLHLGFISVYLSDQLVEGMTTGAAVLVVTSQVAQVFGISGVADASGVLGIIKVSVPLLTSDAPFLGHNWYINAP